MGGTTYKDPTPAWVAGVIDVAGKDVDPALLEDPSWTPKERERWGRKFKEAATFAREKGGSEYLVPEYEEPKADAEERRLTALTIRANERAAKFPGRASVGGAVELGIKHGAEDLAGIGIRAADALGAFGTHESEEPLGDTLDHRQEEESQVAGLATQNDAIPDIAQSSVQGAARSVASMGFLGKAGLGIKGITTGFAVVRGSQAITEANDAGLTGAKKWAYVGTSAVIEGAIAGYFNRTGRAGIESIFVGGKITNKNVGEFFRQMKWELVEENITEVADSLNQQLQDVGQQSSPEEWLDQLPDLLARTTFQTLLATGAVGASQRFSGVRREDLVAGYQAKYGWTEEQAGGVVKRAEKRNGNFLENLGREVEDESRLDPDRLTEWAAANIPAARELASKADPSRGDFKSAGLPRTRGIAARRRVVTFLQGFVESIDGVSPVAEELAAPEVQQAVQEPPSLEPKVKSKGLRRPPVTPEESLAASELTLDELRARAAKRMGLKVKPVAARVETGPAAESDVSRDRAATDPSPLPGSDASPRSSTTRRGAIVDASLPKGEWVEAARRRHQLEAAAIEKGSQDWRTADLETLRGLVSEFKIGRKGRKEATERLAVLENPVPENADWKTADADVLTGLLAAKAIHPGDMKAAEVRLGELAAAERKPKSRGLRVKPEAPKSGVPAPPKPKSKGLKVKPARLGAPADPKTLPPRVVGVAAEAGGSGGDRTSARKAMTSADRETMGLDVLDSPARRSWEEALGKARADGIASPDRAMRISAEVRLSPRSLSDVETAGLVHHAAKLKNDHKALAEAMKATTDQAEVMGLGAEAGRVESEFDLLTQALRVSGTEKGRALAAHKLTLGSDFSLIAVKAQAKAAKGKPLTAEESSKLEKLTAELEGMAGRVGKLEAEIQKQAAEMALRENANAGRRRGRKASTKAKFESNLARAQELIRKGCR